MKNKKMKLVFCRVGLPARSRFPAGEIVPDDEPKSAFENSDEFKLREGEHLKEQDDALTDEELLEKYNLPNPEQVENELAWTDFLMVICGKN